MDEKKSNGAQGDLQPSLELLVSKHLIVRSTASFFGNIVENLACLPG
jgi:hypothetical protein